MLIDSELPNWYTRTPASTQAGRMHAGATWSHKFWQNEKKKILTFAEVQKSTHADFIEKRSRNDCVYT